MKILINSQEFFGQKSEDITLFLHNNVIDNRSDDHFIYLREISYYVGYFNISQDLNNDAFAYSNEAHKTHTLKIPDGLYTLKRYSDEIKALIANKGDNPSHINYTYYDYNGKIKISVTPPYTFSILPHQTQLLGFDNPQIITNSALSSRPVNFIHHKMLYIHLKQLKQDKIFLNGRTNDVLAEVPVTVDEFGKLVNHKFNVPFMHELENTTISVLELTITDEKNNLIDFHGMPVFYTLEVCKK